MAGAASSVGQEQTWKFIISGFGAIREKMRNRILLPYARAATRGYMAKYEYSVRMALASLARVRQY
jgi:hypothetical protein